MSPVERSTVVADAGPVAVTGLRRISWGAVIAGMVIAIAVQIVLGLFGTSVGLGTIDPMQPNGVPSAGSLGTGAGVWWTVSSIIALFIGGWTAGHLAGSPDKTDALLHGLLTWGIATIVTVYLLASLVGAIVRGGAAVVGKTADVAASGIGAVAGTAADAAKDKIANSDLSLDDLKAQAQKLLAQTGKPALQPQSVANQASSAADRLTSSAATAGSTGNPPAEDLETTLKRIIASGKDTVAQVDRDAIANVVAARTGLSKAEAEQRTDAWIKQYQQARAQFEQKKAEAEAKARKAADDAASASAKAALGAAIALVLGAIAAAIGGFIARRHPAAPYATGYATTSRRS